MTTADLTYGEAFDVATRLNTAPKVTVDDLTSALINALDRIAALEREVKALQNQKAN